jgi:hypothetical protein
MTVAGTVTVAAEDLTVDQPDREKLALYFFDESAEVSPDRISDEEVWPLSVEYVAPPSLETSQEIAGDPAGDVAAAENVAVKLGDDPDSGVAVALEGCVVTVIGDTVKVAVLEKMSL